MNGSPLKIVYSFSFNDGAIKEFAILLERGNLEIIPAEEHSAPAWAELEKNRCAICLLDKHSLTHCPIALNLANIAEAFKDCFAYENVKVTVTTEERTYVKETIVQEGLGSLVGIIMVASGCPTMEYLKPMVRFHLPFASLAEMIFRMTSVYLLSQYFVKKGGHEPDWNLGQITEIYSRVGQLNRDFSQRLAEAAKKDANINALVNLDCFASMVPIATEDILNELEPYFSAYEIRK